MVANDQGIHLPRHHQLTSLATTAQHLLRKPSVNEKTRFQEIPYNCTQLPFQYRCTQSTSEVKIQPAHKKFALQIPHQILQGGHGAASKEWKEKNPYKFSKKI